MAGLIFISEEKSWAVAGWVFAHVLRQSAPYIPPENRRILDAVHKATEGLDYIDTSVLPPVDRQIFLGALRRGLRRTEDAGSGSFSDPAFYPGFIDRFRELIDMLAADLNESAEGVDKGET